MNYDARFQLALEELHNSGMTKSTTLPPLWRLATRCGLQPRPPHYNSFLFNTLLFGIYFGVFWGIAMYLLVWRAQPSSLLVYSSFALLAGALFGLCMAAHFRYGFKKYKLTSWEQLGAKNVGHADTAIP